MSVRNMNKDLLEKHIKEVTPKLIESFTLRSESSVIRPSTFLSCSRQAYIKNVLREGAELMPDNIGSTFAIGHLLHEVSYAAIKSVIPNGFEVRTELEVQLPEWWPKDRLSFNQEGHIDMLIEISNPEEACKYLPPDIVEEQSAMIVDFKTQGSFSYKKHGVADYSKASDGFGYMTQLGIYADALGLIGNGAILAGINRDQLVKPLLTRHIAPSVLMREVERVKRTFDYVEKGIDPGPEFLIRHGQEAHFYCGRGGKKGYCPFKNKCKKLEDNA